MHSATHPVLEAAAWPVLPDDTPIIYEDEELGDMGEVNRHATTNVILYVCLKSFLQDRHPRLRVFLNMNCYYAAGPKHARTGSLPYFSSDNMIVEPVDDLSEDVRSYKVGQSGPAPLVAIETLSEGTADENDLGTKVKLYADLKIPEYILVDVTGEFLPEKLLLKRLQPDGTWKNERDKDGGVTSNLGFRLLIDENGELVVIVAISGHRYVRPRDAETVTRTETNARKLAERKARQAERKARQAETKTQEAETKVGQEAAERRLAEEKILALQAELERLRAKKSDS